MKRLLILCGVAALAATPAVGQRTPAPNAELPGLQAEYRDELVRARRLRADALEAAGELAELNRRLAGLQQAQSADDAQVAAQRARLDQLSRREAELVAVLSRARAKQGRLLSGLQMMSRDPPPPLLIPADRAVDTVRAAILMRAMAPELEKRARAVVAQQEEIARVRRLAVLSSERLLTLDSSQTDRRSDIEQLSRRKTALMAVLRADAERSERAARVLEARIRALGGRPATPAEVEDAAAVATRLPGGRSRLTAPIPGGSERSANGLSWRGTGRPVAAPADAVVDYAGPLSGWGNVVILDLGPGWRAVLTGLETVSVEAGTRVTDGQALGRSAEEGEVYFELRRADRPIDPRPWLD
ncbi:MAG: murein hydrolase activator EnvC family protein [Brevundimonas sp.]|uniref:murein hydrolase activator EnvC family protein n=2 Tax=Brevundimonas sp. TaxID=1871086 RepID=UPI00403416CD